MKDYYTREELVGNEFLFISYKHDAVDKTVDCVLDYLYEQGVRFWCDIDLGPGQVWTDVAKGLILHENCVGVIFFNSVDSFLSEPVHKERGFALEKLERCKKSGNPFMIFPVNMGYPSVLELIRAVFENNRDKVYLQRNFSVECIHNITKLFPSDIIYCYADPENSEGYLQSLYTMIEKSLPKTINKSVQQLKQIEKAISKEGNQKVTFGMCKDKPSDAVPPALLEKDGPVHLRSGSYIVQNGRAFTVKKLAWRLLYCKNDCYVLASESVIAVRPGGKGEDLKKWLMEAFMPYAFTEEEQQKLKELRLLNAEDVREVTGSEKLAFAPDGDNPEGHWWMDAMAQGALQKVVKKDGKVLESGYNMRTKKSGIRPVIVLESAAMTSILENK